MKKNILLLILLLTGFFGCKKFEYSPYQVQTSDNIMPDDLNGINVARLLLGQETDDDTVTVIFSGDSQRFYEGLENLVININKIPNVDFFILDGDIAEFGILNEYLWVQERLDKLKVPYMCAIGNHDLPANNGEVYVKMFGVKNYSFIYKGYKFVFHDTNGREYNFNGNVPNMPWLNDQLKDTVPNWFVGVSHVPPYDYDFDRVLETPYKNLFAATPGFLASLHGHIHGTTDSHYYNDSIRYITANSVEKQEVVLLKFIHGKIIKQMIPISA